MKLNKKQYHNKKTKGVHHTYSLTLKPNKSLYIIYYLFSISCN